MTILSETTPTAKRKARPYRKPFQTPAGTLGPVHKSSGTYAEFIAEVAPLYTVEHTVPGQPEHLKLWRRKGDSRGRKHGLLFSIICRCGREHSRQTVPGNARICSIYLDCDGCRNTPERRAAFAEYCARVEVGR